MGHEGRTAPAWKIDADAGRGFAIAAAAAVFLAFSGAFGSAGAPLGLRLVYWTTLMLAEGCGATSSFRCYGGASTSTTGRGCWSAC